MKKYILFSLTLAAIIIYFPSFTAAQVDGQAFKVSKSAIFDSADNSSIAVNLTVDVVNYSSSETLKISADGFTVKLNARGISRSSQAKIRSYSGKAIITKNIYQLAPGNQGSFEIEVAFPKSDLFNGSYTAYLDGVHVIEADGTESYLLTGVNRTSPYQIEDAQDSSVIDSKFEVTDVNLSRIDDPAGENNSLTLATIDASISGGEAGIKIKKVGGVSVVTADGKVGVTAIALVSENVVEDGEWYLIPANEAANLTLATIYRLEDLPPGDYSLDVSLAENNFEILEITTPSPSEKSLDSIVSLFQSITEGIKRVFSSAVSFLDLR